jgi:uncharacterized protein YjiK
MASAKRMTDKAVRTAQAAKRKAHLLVPVLTLLWACGAPDVQERAGAEGEPGSSLFAATPDGEWRLPNRLAEISGLAITREGRLFGHDDERAIVYELGLANGDVIKSFALGDPTELGDFEGIAATDDDGLFLITSTGRLYAFPEGEDGAHLEFETYDTGLAPICEAEGLAYNRAQESLIIACKTVHARAMANQVLLYSWSLRTHALGQDPWLSAPEADVAAAAGVTGFHPSSVEVDAATGRVIVLAGSERALAEFGPGGALLAARRLGRAHPQAEGAAILPDGALLIADEAGSRGRARLSRYPRRHD